MAINNGASTQYSDFAVAEVIVFDYELNPKQYKCVEAYLSDKYDINIEPTPCLNDTLLENDPAWDGYLQCNLSDYKLVGWYDGSTFNTDDNVWYDKSGQCYNVDSGYIGGTITTYDNLNGEMYITGTTSTTISFPYHILPLQYTFFHVARYFGTEKRIFQSFEYPWLSGFYSGKSGVAHHGNWITSYTTDRHGSEWVLSSDRRSLYRSQGTSRMTDDQSSSYESYKYRLAVNTGYYPTYDSAFAIAEMIVIDGELNPKELKCMEKQLSDKYGILNSATDCKPKNDSLTTKCGLSRDVFAWYQGDHFDDTEDVFYDDSGYCRNIDSEFISGTITTKTDLNGHQYLTGTTSTRMYFPYDVLPVNYTLFHVARYNDGTEDIIFQAYDYSWISGFYAGAAGVALHQNWITSSSVDSHSTNWVISQDQRSVYRSNGVPRMTDSQTSSYKNNRYRLAINNGYHGTDDSSDWAVAEVIVFDYEMDASEYQCVEQYLGTKYDISMVNDVACEDLSQTDHDILAECGVEEDIFAWYDGATFDFDENAWFDKSGFCRNVESEFISGTVNINTDLNNKAYLTGTTSTSMAFPHDVLPQDYTFFHVAKWNDGGARNRIFQSFDYDFLSGFDESASSGVAFHENWITPAVDIHGADWVVSTDSRSLYRSNGVSRHSDNQSPAYHTNKYKLGLNTGLYTGTTYTSDWSVAEIVVFDKTLNPPEYKCMENYLALKYDLCLTTHAPTAAPTATTEAPTQNPTDSECLSAQDLALRDLECQSADLTEELYVQCELTEDDIYAWYNGDSYNEDLNQWFDKSGNCRNVKDAYISGTITTYDDLNGKTYLTGSTTTSIDFPYDVLPAEYTFFHMARYFDGTESKIFQAYDYNWCSGFYSGYAGAALHESWITPSNIDLHGREWVISTDQRSMYRSDGKMRTTATQTTSYANNRYRLAINNGLYPTHDSDWAVAEIIVMDYEANTKTIKCVENYLSTKYDETIYESECKDTDVEVNNLGDQCGFDSERLFAWFGGDSYDEDANIWYDKSGHCRNVDNDYISGALDVQHDLNGHDYVNGSTSTIIQFPFEILPKDYTFMHVARKQPGGTHSRIFQSNTYNWLSGFELGGISGVACHENWITASSSDNHGTGWVVSTDQRSLYRSNGVSRLTDSQSPSYWNNRYELTINKGYKSTYKSDFAVAEMLVFDEELLASQYKCMESYLSDKYDLTLMAPYISGCLNNTDTNSFQTQCNTLDGGDLQPFAWYDGSSYSFSDTLWMDKSGHCRNIESEHISGDIFSHNDLNGNTYLRGTSSSTMEFPYEVLPQTYTFIHVAKWISSATGRIFNAFDYDWWSGFGHYYVTDVSAYHGNWITPRPGSASTNYVKDWIISTDQRNIYRANGVFKMTNDQDAAYKSHRYRLGLNTGLSGSSYHGDWAVAEVLVFDRELDPVEYKCIEQYLADKYNISITSTDCKPQTELTDTITDQCGLKQSPVAWYNGDSFNSTENTWFDHSQYCRNIDNEFITNTISFVDNDPYNEMNGKSYITGTTSTGINFPYELLPLSYNFFHVARYYDGTEDVIFQSYDYSWLSGFYDGYAGVALHRGWITPAVDTYGRQWMISNDQRSLFRTNGIGRTSNTQSASYAANHYRLAINLGYWGTSHPSHFAIAEIVIFDYELTSKEYKCVESFLCDKYDKLCHQSAIIGFEQIDIDNANAILLSEQCPDINTSNIVAWYNGDSYDPVDNIWFDQSGYARNVDSEYISGSIDMSGTINAYKYVAGSTSTTIDFPFDLLPQSYTFMHVAKYNGDNKDRIFQSYDFSWTSGFTNGLSGSAYHQSWITSSSVDQHGSEWVLSTDQRNLYRSNGVDRMTDDQTTSYNDNRYILTVNNGVNGGEDSDFGIAEMLIFDEELSIAHYRCVEEYLAIKYNLCLPVPSATSTTTTPIIEDSYCEENGLIEHVDWNDMNRTSPAYVLATNVAAADLAVNVELITDYIGYAYDEKDQMVGSAYVFDFAQFDSFEDRLEEPGSCSNRLASSYEGKTWTQYWQYSDAPAAKNQLGTTQYLAYGPLPSHWTLSALDNCTTIRYSGEFSWSDLRKCASFDGDKLMQIQTDDAWINMTGRFYVSVISPYSMFQDIGIYYVEDLVTSYPFQISIRKSIHILNHIGIEVFLVTIFQSRRTFNKTHSNDGGGYVVILSSQTAEFMQLTEPNLLSNPPEYNTWSIAPLNNADCYINSDDVCIQFWRLYIEQLDCPIAFDGEFAIEWTAVCTDDGDTNNRCTSHLNTYGNQTALSIGMAYYDPFDCDAIDKVQRGYDGIIRFYTDSSFTQQTTDDPPIYRSGVDSIYVEIEVIDLDAWLNANLLNVWICAPSNDDDILQITVGDEINSGCFDSALIDANTFNAIIVNEQTLLFSPLIYDTALHNVVRFSFSAPDWVGVTFVYIHSEIALSDAYADTRRRLLNQESAYDPYIHVVAKASIESEDNGENPEEKQDTMLWFIVLTVVGCTLVASAVLFAIVRQMLRANQRKKHVDCHVDINDNNHNIPPFDGIVLDAFGDIAVETDAIVTKEQDEKEYFE
eukprot:1110183_1